MQNTIQDNLLEKLQKENDALRIENAQLKKDKIEIDKAKQLYIGILESFPALIWRANTEKSCDYFNRMWLDFTGKTMEEEYGNGWTKSVHPDDLDKCIEIYTTHFDKRDFFSMEYRLRNSNGDYRWILDYGRPFYDVDGTFLGYIGSCYDITENKKNLESLKELAITDPLTHIFNRLRLDEILDNEIKRAQRYKNPLSLIMIDVDDFKSVNDSHGHNVGDLVLIQLVQTIQNHIRSIDTFGRWGGEEFLIICPETDAAQAESIAEKLRSEIQTQDFSEVHSKTCSFGVATYMDGDSAVQLIQKADNALYVAKQNGKNQVKVIL